MACLELRQGVGVVAQAQGVKEAAGVQGVAAGLHGALACREDSWLHVCECGRQQGSQQEAGQANAYLCEGTAGGWQMGRMHACLRF